MEQCLLKNVRQRAQSTSSTADTTSKNGLFDVLQSINRIPGLLAREERILNNTWSGILEHYERTGQLVNPQEIDPSKLTWYDFISGRTGFAALLLCLNVESLQKGAQQAYPFYLGVGTAQALIAYHEEHKNYPQDLQELASIYSLPLQFSDLDFTYKSSLQGATLTINAPSSPKNFPQDLKKILESSGQKNPWISLDDHKITFKLWA